MYYLIQDQWDNEFILMCPESHQSSIDWSDAITECLSLPFDYIGSWNFPRTISLDTMSKWAAGRHYLIAGAFNELPTKQSHPELFI